MVDSKKNNHEKYLLLLKLDATNLFERIETRLHEFLDDFSLKRDRAIFKEVFFSRYNTLQMHELAHFSSEVIELANIFYKSINELLWYLCHTQDMPNTIEDEVIRANTVLKKQIANLVLYVDAELSGVKENELKEA